MGDKARRRREFLAKHPFCCFCGGTTPATTIDHVPSKQLFDGRRWPEGYEFPACNSCNQSTRQEEQVVALFSRFFPGLETDEARRDFQRALQGVKNNLPEVLKELQPITGQHGRQFLQSRGIQDPGFVASSGPLVSRCISVVGIKLFSALHYRHNGRIIPNTGGVSIRWYTNVDVMDGVIPPEVVQFLGDPLSLQRCNTSLAEQFTYRVRSTGQTSMYLVSFRQAFAMAGLVHEDASLFLATEGEMIFNPPHHRTSSSA